MLALKCSLCDYWTEGRWAKKNLLSHLVAAHAVQLPPDGRRVENPQRIETEYERGYQAGYRKGRRAGR